MGNVFYVGYNQHREKYGNIFHTSLHAETHALIQSLKAMKRKGKSRNTWKTMYVVRLANNHNTKAIYSGHVLANSKPCAHCQKTLIEYRVARVKYTDTVDGVNVLCEMRLTS